MDETLIGKLEKEEKLEGSFEESVVEGKLEKAPVEISIKDHNKLDNRDLADQHPIDAITGLKQELINIKNNQTNTGISIKNLTTQINNKIRTVKEIPLDMKPGEYIFLEKEENING